MVTNSIAKWRMAKGVSKAHLARQVGVDRSYITKLEQGTKQPSGEMMFRFAEYLGQPIQAVFQHISAKISQPPFDGSEVMPKRQTISHPSTAPDGSFNNAGTNSRKLIK